MDIFKILTNGETEKVEFKSSLSEKKQIVETISAFSNKAGGSVFVGINDDADVIGIDIGKNTLENLANEIRRETDPQVSPSIKVMEIESENVILIKVSESQEKPVFSRGRAYTRIGKTNQRLSASEIKQIIENKSITASWDERICEKASLEDINEKTLSWFLQKAKYERNLDIDPIMPVEEALNKLELLKEDNLTNAAVLLFSDNLKNSFCRRKPIVQDLKVLKP